MRDSHNPHRRRRVVAALGALTLSLIGVTWSAAPASADDYGNVDNTKAGSIIIHKHVHQTSTSVTASPDGSASIPSAGISGVEFTAYRVTGIDLTTKAGWDAVATLTPTCPPPAGTTVAGAESTGAGGLATISLPAGSAVGAYIVCETRSPSNVVDKAQPFVVTIPFSYQRTVSGSPVEGWLYNVNVYPKNGVADVGKTVAEQTNLGLGATASFPVTTDIPKIASNANFLYYWVQDPMDSRLTGATVSSVQLAGGTNVPNAGNVNYTVTTSATNVVSVQFTTAGLAWLKTHAPDRLVTTFTGTVNGLGTDGVINNTAYFGTKTAAQDDPPDSPQAPPSDPTTSPDTNPSPVLVTQRWGDLKLAKVDRGSSSAVGLAGAKFLVYAADPAYVASGDCTSVVTTGSPVVVNGVGTSANPFVSGDNGALTVAGLFVSDSVHATIDASQRCYVVEEIEAPAGFALPAGDSAKTAVTVKAGVSAAVEKSIPNTRLSGVRLPMTGSDGLVVFSVVGAGLVALGLAVAVVSRRRRSQTA